ncbi:primosomal protein N' [Marinobacter panjinensis]|uniref:Replication restart protein PriA n=1 Tax=Marinobacter panjinensis TaxID=2576384 RepID=A0A4U6QT69_9GAMM|nr:primosomal protein N' [Marinobacter panjinensis]MCR8916478.1 primosomal protein N' [Marinobacter panjinensis]TKV63306.1 primosomal protein N' [Marinobacter panjinensis]
MEPHVPRTARIALNRPLRRLFDYLVPDHMVLQKGQRVMVPFGRQSATGLVADTDAQPPEGITLKPVRSVCEEWPALPKETFKLLSWAADYYQHPLGECLFTALPPALRRGRPAVEKKEAYWKACGDPAVLSGNATRQRELLAWLQSQPGSVSARQIVQAGFTQSQIRSLQGKDLIVEASQPEPVGVPEEIRNRIPRLSQAQLDAADQLPVPENGFAASLLYGITGSGKTELYLYYLKHFLGDRGQALVLVPEINLTPQTVARFQHYFGSRIVVWHSALNDGERLTTWLKVRSGEPVIMIGTRSAVLLPFTNLKTIIVDEEHDSSYKQGEGFRYSGRDTAVYRAHLNNCPVILGSATPSMESYHNALTGKYSLITLEERAGNARPPHIKLLDIRSRPLEGGLSRPALQAIEKCLQDGQQALVFVNRRGFAPIMMCFDCGHMVECPRCDTRLTYHRRDRAMRCHHCDFQTAATDHCPKCNSDAFKPVGQGTERTEDILTTHFPDAPVVRVDRDSTQRKGSIQGILKKVNSGRPCILVGTQMLAKGHDFPNVTLVVVINADGGLFSVDFRAPEQLIQTLLQVSGRAGRGEKSGEVLIQTCHSDHPLLGTLAQGDYLPIANQMLAEREANLLPPYRAMAIFRVEGDTMQASLRLLDDIKSEASHRDIECWGPLPAIIARRADRHRAQLVLVSLSRTRLNRQLAALCHGLDLMKLPKDTKWAIDVDPLETG